MYYLFGVILINGNIRWDYSKSPSQDSEEGLKISITLQSFHEKTKRNAIQSIENAMQSNKITWALKKNKKWIIDLTAVKNVFSSFKDLNTLDWFRDSVIIEPELESSISEIIKNEIFTKSSYKYSLCFYITPECKEGEFQMNTTNNNIPIEILESVKKFKIDYPSPIKTAFIMMQFSNTPAHEQIASEIKRVLKNHNIIGLRADDKEYADDLLANIRTYMHSCDFGVAVFERLLKDVFNPNVSLEVGYLMGLNKPVCLLKDSTLSCLHTDLTGKLYKSFDPQNICGTLESEFEKWLRDRNIIE